MMDDLKSRAHHTKPIVTIGKNGFTEQQMEEVKKVLRTKKLVKIQLLRSAAESPKAVAEKIVQRTKATVVSCVGRTIVVWKR